MTALMSGAIFDKIPYYRSRNHRVRKTTVKFSRWHPHQGKQEMARRRRQLSAGIIQKGIY